MTSLHNAHTISLGEKDVDLNKPSDSSAGSSAEDVPPDSDSDIKSTSSSYSSSSSKAQTGTQSSPISRIPRDYEVGK